MPQSYSVDDVSSSEQDLHPAPTNAVASSPLAVNSTLSLNSATPQLGCAVIELLGRGAKIVGITAGSVADQAGLCVGDIISSVNTVPVMNFAALKLAFSHSNPGDLVTFGLMRADQNLEVSIRLAHGNLVSC